MSEQWRNWAGDQHCTPARIERPRSTEEVVAAVRRAAAQGLTVRAAGSGHSFSDCACTDGVMLDLGALDRVHEVDAEAGLVRVGAGITLGELGRRLDEQGLAMENLGDIDRQTLAGAMATGTHGTGIGYPNVSGQVEAIELVAADGEVHELRADRDRESFRAARVGLGALGIVTAVTVRVVPAFTLRRVDRQRPLDEVLDDLEAAYRGHDHFELYVFPHTDVALCRETTRTDEPPQPRDARSEYLQEVVLENWAIEAMARIGRAAPRTIPALTRFAVGRLGGTTKMDRSHRVFVSRRRVRFTETEYAIPIEHGAEAVRRVLDLVERRRIAVAFPIEVRFTPRDDAHLSTAYGRDTCYLAAHQHAGAPWEPYFRGVEAIMDDYKGRPHWGKRHFQRAESLRGRYPKWAAFQKVRAELDPDGLFANEYLDRVLGPVRQPQRSG